MFTITSADFVVCEQEQGCYTPHIFLDREQFVEWRQKPENQRKNITHTTSANGKMNRPEDHRWEW